MAGSAAYSGNALYAGHQGACGDGALTGPGAVQRQQPEIGAFKIDTAGESASEGYSACAAVYDAYAPGDDAVRCVKGVGKLNAQAGERIRENEHQGLRAVAAGGRKSLQRRLAWLDAPVGQVQVQRCGAVRVADMQHALPKVAEAEGRTLLRQAVQGQLIHRKTVVIVRGKPGEQVIGYGAHRSAPVRVQRITACGEVNDIAYAAAGEIPAARGGIKGNGHGSASLIVFRKQNHAYICRLQ